MRHPFILIGLLIILSSCATSLSVSDVETNNILNEPSDNATDSSIEELVAPYRKNLQEDMSKVIAVSSEELTKAKPESKLTNLIADLLLSSGIAYCRMNNKDFRPDMAFVNYGGLRVSLPRGQITVGNIYELMPFENMMVLLKLRGETMEEFIQQIAAQGGAGVAGIKLGIKSDEIGHLEIDGEPFAETREYWVVTNDYIAGGGDDMEMLTSPLKYINTGFKIRDLIIDGLSHEYKAENRIKVELDGRIYNE